jgi:hypothetical protein
MAVKITKNQAIALLRKGETIYLLSSKCGFDLNAAWVQPFPVCVEEWKTKHGWQGAMQRSQKFPYTDDVAEEFEKLINNFAYYNCVPELGTKVTYYIK